MSNQTSESSPLALAATTPKWAPPAKTFSGNVIAGIVASLLTPVVIAIYDLFVEEARKTAGLVNVAVVGVGIVLVLIIGLNSVVTYSYTKNKKILGTRLFVGLQIALVILGSMLVVLLLTVANKPA